MILQSNPQLELAFEYVRNTNQCVYLTGKAGTGKTTFLQQVKADGTKRMAIVAPTGVAAINAGGMTMHSLFQLPLGIFLPGVPRADGGQQRRFKRDKVRLIRNLDLLVIDEISMVRADLLDAVDDVLRRFRDHRRPFGGVQLLMIGDLHQLPPVVKTEDWNLLSGYYETPYFFGSRALQRTGYVSIELQHIYRQRDTTFIDLLNKVRNNRLDEAAFRQLNSRYIANFRPPVHEPYITLTATNAAAQEINAASLRRLSTPRHVFHAAINGEFPPSSYPTEETLEFKPDAQVMFIRNDTQTERRYFNGKLGRITRIDENRIFVSCSDEEDEIEVERAEWQNIRYSLNEETQKIDERIVGTFNQFPLKLAWAITIHKSQGLTFDRAIIDAEEAFAHGQVYVALSRCKSFEGIVLRSRIHESCVKTDPVVRQFTENMERQTPSESQLQQAKREFQVAALGELFGFHDVASAVSALLRTCQDHAQSLAPETLEQVPAWTERVKTQLCDVAEKFAPQLAGYLAQEELPTANESLQARVKRASVYFKDAISTLWQEGNSLPLGCDNQDVGHTLAAQRRALQLAIFVKRACFAACHAGFSVEACQRALANAELDFQHAEEAAEAKSLARARESERSGLYGQLVEWRERESQLDGRPAQEIIPDMSLREVASRLPRRDGDLRSIIGIGKGRRRRYGEILCQMVEAFLANQARSEGSPRRSDRPAREKKPKGESQRATLDMWRSGQTLDEIAKRRGLTRGTIESHLAQFVARGELDVHAVLSPETVAEIQRFLAQNPQATISVAKARFGDKYSHGVLRMVIGHVQVQAKPSS